MYYNNAEYRGGLHATNTAVLLYNNLTISRQLCPLDPECPMYGGSCLYIILYYYIVGVVPNRNFIIGHYCSIL